MSFVATVERCVMVVVVGMSFFPSLASPRKRNKKKSMSKCDVEHSGTVLLA